jgi:hypothetical protein
VQRVGELMYVLCAEVGWDSASPCPTASPPHATCSSCRRASNPVDSISCTQWHTAQSPLCTPWEAFERLCGSSIPLKRPAQAGSLTVRSPTRSGMLAAMLCSRTNSIAKTSMCAFPLSFFFTLIPDFWSNRGCISQFWCHMAAL